MQHQVGLEAGEVVLALALLVEPGAPLGQEPADRLDGGDPVAEVGQLGVALGDRGGGAALAAAPVVDDVGEDVDLRGPEVGEHVHPGVLVEDAFGERDEVVVPEGAPEQLVPDRAVVDERVEAGDVGAAPVLLHRGLVQRGLPLLGGVHHLHVARDEVRAGLLQGAHEQFVGVLRDDVVAVDERDELPARMHGPQAGVPGVARAVRLLADQPEARVGRAELGDDLRRAVGGTVVDEDDLEVAERLTRDRLQALREIALDVLKGHDNTETRMIRQLRLLPRQFAR